MENTSGIVDNANGLIANPKSFPDRASPPQGPDSSIVMIKSETSSSAPTEDIRAGIPIHRLTKIGALFFLNTANNSKRSLLAITRSCS